MTQPIDGQNRTADPALCEVFDELKRRDPDGARWAAVIRHTYDMIYNGQETGRYRWDQLMKTEKTHFGTLFEINAQREFEFDNGITTDYTIAGHQVDAKWSQTMGAWMLPPEVFGELALVASGDDGQARWSLGLIRITSDVRKEATNRDQKSQLNAIGRASVRWLWHNAALRPNVLLQLETESVERIFSSQHGTQRTHQLFREAEGRIVHRNVVATVSRQLDHQKRVRSNGGSRTALRPEGYLILSGTFHHKLAAALDLPVPLADEYISVRVVPAVGDDGVLIAGRRWRRAAATDLIDEPAPMLHDERGGTA